MFASEATQDSASAASLSGSRVARAPPRSVRPRRAPHTARPLAVLGGLGAWGGGSGWGGAGVDGVAGGGSLGFLRVLCLRSFRCPFQRMTTDARGRCLLLSLSPHAVALRAAAAPGVAGAPLGEADE